MDIWTYQETSQFGTDLAGSDISGFEVEAIDGSIGKIDEATYDLGASYVVVDTGPWIFGKKVMLPAGVVSKIDEGDEKVFVARTKDEIKNAPELDDVTKVTDTSYRSSVGTYYGEGGEGFRESGKNGY